MTSRRHLPALLALALAIALGVTLAVGVAVAVPRWAGADHESTSTLTFAPPEAADTDADVDSDASGTGTIDYRGGDVLDSRWTAIFALTGLAPDTAHTVVVQGQFGENGSPEADAFTAICGFTTDAQGDGGCWHYFVQLRHLGVVEVRVGGTPDDLDGATVLMATADETLPGEITRVPNAYSGTPTAIAAQAATAVAAGSPAPTPHDPH